MSKSKAHPSLAADVDPPTPPSRQSLLRRWIERLYAFDERLHERITGSRAVTIILVSAALVVSALLGAFIVVWHGISFPVLVTLSPIFCVIAVSLWFGRQRYREQVMDQRRKAGQCVVCGYDLRASTDQCPECGTEIFNS